MREPIIDWLRDRLTPYKQKEIRWHDLARALEEYWDAHSTPALERLENLKSVFTSTDTDIEKLLRELGIKFEVALPIFPDNLPFAYAWRLYEIHRKDRADTLAQILRRDFPDVEVLWQPLFARKGVPYGEEFLTEQEAAFLPSDQIYRTYRGRVLVSQDDLRRTGVDLVEFEKTCKRKMEVLRPAHIVYDDVTFFRATAALFCPARIERGCRRTTVSPHYLTFSLIGRYDEVAADVQTTDLEPISSAYCTNP